MSSDDGQPKRALPKMRILVLYGTSEGHTRDLAQFAARLLRRNGHEAFAVEAPPAPASLSLAGWDAAIVAASLHMGRYQPNVVDFLKAHRLMLGRIPIAFLSVSLSAAGKDAGDWKGLERCVAALERDTHWTPLAIHHAAGAIRYSRYGILKRLLLKMIARKRGKSTVTSRDYDLTDYSALKAFILEFEAKAAAAIAQSRSAGAGAAPEAAWMAEPLATGPAE